MICLVFVTLLLKLLLSHNNSSQSESIISVLNVELMVVSKNRMTLTSVMFYLKKKNDEDLQLLYNGGKILTEDGAVVLVCGDTLKQHELVSRKEWKNTLNNALNLKGLVQIT